jgi:hypothetical protein
MRETARKGKRNTPSQVLGKRFQAGRPQTRAPRFYFARLL